MASHLVGVHSFRRPTTRKVATNDDMAINLSLTHSQSSHYHRVGDGSSASGGGGGDAGVSSTRRRSRNGDVNCKRAWSALVNNNNQGPRLPKMRKVSPDSYLFRKIKALLLYFRIRGAMNNGTMIKRGGNQVMAVEPYFSMPVVPVTACDVPPV